MRQTFVTNLILLLALNLLVKPFYILGIEAEIQNRVGPEVFGSYFALINFSFLLNIIPDMGTTNWNTRHIAQNSHLLSKHFSKIFSLRLVLTLLYILVVLVVGQTLQYSATQIKLLWILALSQVFAMLIMFLRSNLTGMHLFKQDSLISILDRSLLIAMMTALLYGNFVQHSFQIEWLVWGQAISYGITFFVALFFVLRKSGGWHWDFENAFSISILKQSFPYALLIFISMIAYRVDTVMIERMRGQHDAGVYAMSFRFFEAVNMIAYLFAVLLLPIFSRMLKKKSEISSTLNLSFQIMYCGIFTTVLIAFFFGNEIFLLVYDHPKPEAQIAFFWLLLSALFFSLQYIFGTLITASGRMKPLIYTALVAVILNITLNLFLIPYKGVFGAAIASCTTQGIVLIVQIILVRKLHQPKGQHLVLLRTIFFSVLCTSCGIIFSHCAINDWTFALRLGFFLTACFAAAIATGMLNVRRFFALLQAQEEGH